MVIQSRIIENYPDYIITSTGDIISNRRVHQIKLKPRKTRSGYYLVALYNINGDRKDLSISRLMAFTFIDNPHNYKEVNHIDGDKSNNSINNLEWCTRSYNILHAYDNKLKISSKGEINGSAKLTNDIVSKIREGRKNGMLLRELAEQYNVSISAISRIYKRITWNHII